MFATAWKQLGRWAMIGAVSALSTAGLARGQEANEREVRQLKAQFEAQQQTLRQLTQQFEARRNAAAAAPLNQGEKIRSLAESVFKEKEDQKKLEAEAQAAATEHAQAVEGYEIGTALGMTARWGRPDSERGLILETANEDFIFHIGGRFQQDWVAWQQDPGLRKPTAAGGIGPLEDGVFFRRIRLQMDGEMWDTVVFNMAYSFESLGTANTGQGALEEFYAGMKDLPWVGEMRVGQIRVPQGLEATYVSSNKAGTFLESAAMADAFFNNLGPGIWLGNYTCDARLHWFLMAYRQEGGSISAGSSLQPGTTNGTSILDGDFAYTGRLVALPVYMYEGAELVHVGLSATYRNALPNSATPSSPNFVDFSARPQMRDTNGNFAAVGPGNGTRFVSTGPLQASDDSVLDTELLWIHGPFSAQAEWAFASAYEAVGQRGTPMAGKGLGTVGFNGGYLQLSYILTGEHRLYEKQHARLSSLYLQPRTPFFLVRNGSDGISSGLGAWEIAARYSYLNLNDGDVRGGIMDGESAGLNWYLNPHLRVMFDYEHAQRYDLGTSAILGGVGSLPGAVNSFGVRTQIVF